MKFSTGLIVTLVVITIIAGVAISHALLGKSSRKPSKPHSKNCLGKKCGESDGAGGICQCPDGQKCIDGSCCISQCDGTTCGHNSDGCGGECKCPTGTRCMSNGTCCEKKCDGKSCGQADMCGGICGCTGGKMCNNGTCCESDGKTAGVACTSDCGCDSSENLSCWNGKCVLEVCNPNALKPYEQISYFPACSSESGGYAKKCDGCYVENPKYSNTGHLIGGTFKCASCTDGAQTSVNLKPVEIGPGVIVDTSWSTVTGEVSLVGRGAAACDNGTCACWGDDDCSRFKHKKCKFSSGGSVGVCKS